MIDLNIVISAITLIVTIWSLCILIVFQRRSLRPIVSAGVTTYESGNTSILYSLVILNSGALPARDVKLETNSDDLIHAFGNAAFDANKDRWLACFERVIPLLQNGARVSCSFGYTEAGDAGFWKYGASLPIKIKYNGWFGSKYEENQTLQILDSESFTGMHWGETPPRRQN
jgi:hypothetical protein